jgi:hypothetical protein
MRRKILSLRVQRPPNPTLEMASCEEIIGTQDGTFRVRVLRPRTSEAMPAVIYFHGGGFFAGGIDETDELDALQNKPTPSSSTSTTILPPSRSSRLRSTTHTRRCAGLPRTRRVSASTETGS